LKIGRAAGFDISIVGEEKLETAAGRAPYPSRNYPRKHQNDRRALDDLLGAAREMIDSEPFEGAEKRLVGRFVDILRGDSQNLSKRFRFR